MPLDVRGCTRATLSGSACVYPSPRGVGNPLNPTRDRDWGLQLFPMNEEFPVSAGHKLALIKSLPFVHTARRYYRLDGLVRSSDRGPPGRRRPWRSAEKTIKLDYLEEVNLREDHYQPRGTRPSLSGERELVNDPHKAASTGIGSVLRGPAPGTSPAPGAGASHAGGRSHFDKSPKAKRLGEATHVRTFWPVQGFVDLGPLSVFKLAPGRQRRGASTNVLVARRQFRVATHVRDAFAAGSASPTGVHTALSPPVGVSLTAAPRMGLSVSVTLVRPCLLGHDGVRVGQLFGGLDDRGRHAVGDGGGDSHALTPLLFDRFHSSPF
ncbi:hypothetical protein CRENBAI_005577 [Crenichthys baileyi]|uniref:Uncharacterized protein n=1 Tax=Crenichthys baileyi TaxID=28760 RepID=A0AAV9SF37_9TELE